MSDERIQDLIGDLKNFRTRSAAARQLAAMGGEALAALSDALGREGHEGAKWAIINCLGRIGDPGAVPVLTPYLEESHYHSVAHDALVKIVGEDLGLTPRDWLRQDGPGRQAAERDTAEPGRESPAPQADKMLLEEALEGSGATWRSGAEGRFPVSLPVAGDRRQEVTVVFDSKDHEGSAIVIVFSHCGEARPEHYETVLRQNLRMPYGAVALRDIGGKPCFVMFNTILRHGLSPVELRKSIFAVGERADRVRRQLRA